MFRAVLYTKGYFRRWGKKGGLIGGKARAEKLSPRRRSEIAAMGAAAREAKREKKKNGED